MKKLENSRTSDIKKITQDNDNNNITLFLAFAYHLLFSRQHHPGLLKVSCRTAEGGSKQFKLHSLSNYSRTRGSKFLSQKSYSKDKSQVVSYVFVIKFSSQTMACCTFPNSATYSNEGYQTLEKKFHVSLFNLRT